ncbi:glycosyltransferase family 4 protein [Candidatus Dojkabacteria bacterium]|nr:glycosyltransferase family 4 protein [Candidatus Dojkabacteria bacterium]
MKIKKILSLSPYNPYHTYSGATTRIFYLNSVLAKRYKVFIVVRNEGDLTPTFDSIPIINSSNRIISMMNPVLMIRLLLLVWKEKIDLVYVNSFWLGLYAFWLRIFGVPYFVDEQNVEFIRFKRVGNPIWRIAKIYEYFLCRFAMGITCTSEVDRNFLINQLGVVSSKIQVIRNGVDSKKYQLNPKAREKVRSELGIKDEQVFYFNGHFKYAPNIEALEHILKYVVPVLQLHSKSVRLLIVGSGEIPEDLKDKLESYDFVDVVGFVEILEDYISAADVCLVPLSSGGGTRIKIFEALRNGKYVISTPIGAEGIDVDFPNLKIAQLGKDFSDALEKIIGKTDLVGREDILRMEKLIKPFEWEYIAGGINFEETKSK